MQIVAAAFVDETSAHQVRERLAAEHGIGGPQVAVAPLVPPEPLGGERTIILAVYVAPEATRQVMQLIERHGGSIVADVDARAADWEPAEETKSRTHG